MAKDLPDVKFLLMGSQCQAFQREHIPQNVGLLGVLDDENKNYLFSIVDVALNPMRSGSGTNLKMFDYMAAGIPVVSTLFGARGLGTASQYLYLADDSEDFEKAIMDAIDNNDTSKQLKARETVESIYDWRSISEMLAQKLSN
jgi:glycosyltransferase involved in cell wall biosynthesis